MLRIWTRDPVLFWPLDMRSGIGFIRIPDIFESLVTIFWAKSSIIRWKLAQIYFFNISKINNFQLCELCGYKKRYDKNFFSPLSFVAVFGSGIRDQGWVKIRIRDKHSGYAPANYKVANITTWIDQKYKNYLRWEARSGWRRLFAIAIYKLM